MPTTSPSDDGDLDLFKYVGEKSEHESKAALWYGIVMGMLFVLGAYWANGYLHQGVPLEGLPPTWYDWVWVVVALLGIFGSFAIARHLSSVRRPGDRPYDALAAVGGAVSLALVIILALDSFVQVRSFLSLSETALWPDMKPLWFLPLSVLGSTLPIVSLLMVRGGDARERAIGIVLACIPPIVLLLPLLLDFGAADLVRWIPSVYAAAGLALMFSGTRPILTLSDVTMDSLEYLSSRVFILVMGAVAIIGWLSVESGGVLSTSWDLIWFLPLLASLILSVMLLSVARRAPGRLYDLRPESVGLVGLVWSLVFVFMFVLGMMDVGVFGEVRTIWLYPLSLVGVAAVMVGVNILGKGTWIDQTVGVACALIPLLVTGIIAVAAGPSEPVSSAGTAPYMLSDPLLSEENALWAYLGFAVAVLVSGLKVETFFTMQLPILREKSSLTRRRLIQIMRQVMRNPMGLIGVVILIVFAVIAAIGPYIAPYEVDMTINGEFTPYEGQSSEHWMGVDNVGHDVFSELLYGARTSIIVGVVAAAISSVLGALIGLYSGYVGGWKDEVIMRLNDIVLSIPWLVLMIIIAAFMGTIDLTGIILVIGLTGWSGTARLVRAQVLSLRERQYIERAKAIGSDDFHIINRHILPNAFPLVFANTILTVAVSILSEATLSFLGLRPQGTVTWGTMLSFAQAANAFSLGLHWWIIAPGLCIVLVVLGFTLLGYALDDVMNPKLRKR